MRNDWEAVYKGQEIVLEALKNVEALIFGGGTAIHRAVLSTEYRESEDIDLFIDHYCSVGELGHHASTIKNALAQTGKIRIENYLHRAEEQSHRFFCTHEGSDEVIKIELLNFTAGRFGDQSFIASPLFTKTENSYNLILYKMKALCDRHDTIKDLYDLFFLFGEHEELISIKELLVDLSLKFESTTGYKYGPKEIIKALNAKNRQWDIIEKNIPKGDHAEVVNAIYDFRDDLLEALLDDSAFLDLSYAGYIRKQIQQLDFDITEKEYIETIEPNGFKEAILSNYMERIASRSIFSYPACETEDAAIQMKKPRQ